MPKKIPRKHQNPQTDGYDKKKIKIAVENAEGNKTPNHRKYAKSD